MFTGIVEELGTLESCETVGRGSITVNIEPDIELDIELDIVAKQIERLLEPYRP